VYNTSRETDKTKTELAPSAIVTKKQTCSTSSRHLNSNVQTKKKDVITEAIISYYYYSIIVEL